LKKSNIKFKFFDVLIFSVIKMQKSLFKNGEVIIDEIEKDIRVRIKDAIIKIVFNDSGLKEILVDDVIVYNR
jgi:hypothetical protein